MAYRSRAGAVAVVFALGEDFNDVGCSTFKGSPAPKTSAPPASHEDAASTSAMLGRNSTIANILSASILLRMPLISSGVAAALAAVDVGLGMGASEIPVKIR